MKKLIAGTNNHIFISGITRSGKTYFAGKALEQLRPGVLFLNIQDADLPQKFTRVNASDVSFHQLRAYMAAGHKIDLRFPASRSEAEIFSVYGFLADQILKAGFNEDRPVYIAIDECQILRGEALHKVEMLATRGLYRGARCCFITQRPALASKTLYTQSFEQYIFRLSAAEREYFKSKGIDFDECQRLWDKNGDHSYIYFNGIDLKGYKAI